MITCGAEAGAGLLPPIALLNFYFYSDSIGDKPVQILDSPDTQRAEDQNQQELSVSDRPAHKNKYPFIEEFSEFIASVSTDSLKYKLMTQQQRTLAEAFWAAENYGGDVKKCEKRLEEIYGKEWRTVTNLSDHMAEKREYYEYVLILDHQRQWENSKNALT